MEIRYNVTGAKRKELVKVIADTTGARAEYKFMPTCNYEIDYFTVTKDGTLLFDDRADSEENVIDTYLHAWQAMPPQRPAILSAFLGKIARNLALNRYKARSAQKRQGDVFALSLDELDDCAPALSLPDDEATAAELGRSISAFLRTQSEEVRSMFILRYFYCEPVEALAARFHCGESRIKTTLLRTRRKLKEHLIKEGYCEA